MRKGTSCHNIPMKNEKYRIHGGKSIGVKDRKSCIKTKTPQATKQGSQLESMKP
ncbi:hypothetical protein [Aneurinibacillus aneurinilyticus]|uniref:hypothetical protein n=1 Tax=Aneurinibacillus aneurinilyticus TaxID=1391 RepID=UPI00366EAA81